jgi:hypothetical protein
LGRFASFQQEFFSVIDLISKAAVAQAEIGLLMCNVAKTFQQV